MSVCMGQPHATLHTHDDGGAAKAAREVKENMIVCGTGTPTTPVRFRDGSCTALVALMMMRRSLGIF
jgi:hypothetical protein